MPRTNNVVKRGTSRTDNPVPSRKGVQSSHELILKIQSYRDELLSVEEIAALCGCSYSTALKYLGRPKMHRGRAYAPTRGKYGSEHPNMQFGRVERSGYQSITRPQWMTSKHKRTQTHIAVWCLWSGATELPKGYCIHHKDHNKLNNVIENLELMTIGEHTALHSRLRKV